tara:strand:+ start:58 stop:672 length:615 start_codon:yes stop_codon:yes gene_type:complete
MASGDTDVSICSIALLKLGATSITSFTDGTAPASVCQVIYPKVKASSLSMYPWSFTLTKVQLSRLTSTPNSTWQYEYTLPTSMITGVPRKVMASSSVGSPMIKDYEIQGAKLLTDQTTIFIDYQADVAEGSLPTYFVDFLVHQLCWNLSEAITDQIEKSIYWREVALGTEGENRRGGEFRRAMHIDSAGQTTPVIGEYLLTEVR